MTSLTGTLTKITSQKKLLVKIDESQHAYISKRADKAAENLAGAKMPTWEYTNDDGELVHFVSVTLDKYDKCNLRKFEALLRQRVAISGRFTSYAFIPDGETEQLCGVNFTLASIQKKPLNHKIEDNAIDKTAACARPSFRSRKLTDIEKQMAAIEALELADIPDPEPLSPPELVRQHATSN